MNVQIEIWSEWQTFNKSMRRIHKKSQCNEMPYKIISNSKQAAKKSSKNWSSGHIKTKHSKLMETWRRKKALKTSSKRSAVSMSQRKVARKLFDSYKSITYCRSCQMTGLISCRNETIKKIKQHSALRTIISTWCKFSLIKVSERLLTIKTIQMTKVIATWIRNSILTRAWSWNRTNSTHRAQTRKIGICEPYEQSSTDSSLSSV